MKSKYLERIEEAYHQFNLFIVKERVNNGDYLVLFRNANENYDISELVTNGGNFADTIFDRWCEDARFFKSANNNGRYIVIMLLKQNDNYQLINDYRIWGVTMYITEKEYSTKPDINGNRYSVIFNPCALWFRKGINISNHKPDKYYSRKYINEFVDLLIESGYIEVNRQINEQ